MSDICLYRKPEARGMWNVGLGGSQEGSIAQHSGLGEVYIVTFLFLCKQKQYLLYRLNSKLTGNRWAPQGITDVKKGKVYKSVVKNTLN